LTAAHLITMDNDINIILKVVPTSVAQQYQSQTLLLGGSTFQNTKTIQMCVIQGIIWHMICTTVLR